CVGSIAREWMSEPIRLVKSLWNRRPERIVLSCLPVSLNRGIMAIGFRTKTDEEIRAELQKLSDEQLIERGKMLREFAQPTPGRDDAEDWVRRLQLAREEWKRRHPKGQQ